MNKVTTRLAPVTATRAAEKRKLLSAVIEDPDLTIAYDDAGRPTKIVPIDGPDEPKTKVLLRGGGVHA